MGWWERKSQGSKGNIKFAVFVGIVAAISVYGKVHDSSQGSSGTKLPNETAIRGGWNKPYVDTSCQEFTTAMTDAQRLVAADAIISGDWYADPPSATGGGEGYPNPPSWLVAQFSDRIEQACGPVPGSVLDNIANGLIASDPHWRLEP